MNQRTVRELSKSILSSLEEHGVINNRKASSAEITDLAERLSVLFDSRKRISCTDAAEICGTYPGENPEGGQIPGPSAGRRRNQMVYPLQYHRGL